jgi:hypothetical protein
MLKLWSRRFNIGHGNHWKLERECILETAIEWLKIFQKDEPNTYFILSVRKPKV